MGNLFGGVSQKEPIALEECDSTWETDSGGEEEDDEEPCTGKGLRSTEKGQQQGDHQQQQQQEVAGSVPGADSGPPQSDPTCQQTVKPKRSFYAARDLYRYRHQYQQNLKDLRGQNELCNLRFYMNKIPLKPDGVYIEEILNKWKGDYEKLEHNHTYIQWLFPLREQGLNFYAKELTTFEIEEFKKTKEAITRFLLAYKMMLDFFGIKLLDKNGKVTRTANWQERFKHLNESQHNYLRITRILKSLGELGYESFKVPLVKIFLHEALVENTIPNIKQSALEYFVYTIRDRRERRKLLRFSGRHYRPAEHFIWGPPCKSQLDDSNDLVKPGSPCALTIYSKSRNTQGTPPSCSPKVKTSSVQGTVIEKKEVLKDSPRFHTIKEAVSQSIDTKKHDVANKNCEPKETRNSSAETEPFCLANKADQNHETVSQQPENSEIAKTISTEDPFCDSTVDPVMAGEATSLSVELMLDDQKIS